MDILNRMSVIWPSAWRALELLTGAKEQLRLGQAADAPALRSVASEPRLKRAAEDDGAGAEDATVGPSARALSQEAYRPQAQAQANFVVPSQSGQHAAQQQQQQQQQSYALSMDMHAGGAGSTYLPPSYDRWSTDASALSGFSGSLSTSVLPPQYSTGLVDERLGGALDRAGGGGGAERAGARHPQYWNDYSALGQMETTYGVPVLGEMGHGGAHAQHDGHQAHTHPMYVADQYAMFGEFIVG